MKKFQFLLVAPTCTLLFHLVVLAATSDDLNSEHSADNYMENPNSTEDSEPALAHRVTFRFRPVIGNWDQQRAEWLEKYPHKRLTAQGRPRTILVTSSPPHQCEHPTGDIFQLRSIKNKIDYGRLHMVDVYYNMVVMEMDGFWVKLPIIRRLMLQHPEAEWIWWMDSDAVFIDMDFQIPFENYQGINMIIPGWDDAVYDRREWIGLNAGIFLIRNCQWSLDFLDLWGALGEDYGDHKTIMGEFVSKELTGRSGFEIDDQAGLIWLLISRPELRPQVFLESSYLLHSYWVGVAPRLEEMLAEFQSGGERWPFITHFVGCKLCSGKYNSTSLEMCEDESTRAFNFADDQVLKPYGYRHTSLPQPELVD
ncbi:hypothetical protein R1sor_007690 [Riccia sorocarpa]|uniref:Glycosyltransferase n=1 Tax=Riccia sorocarpa TaxID=122646 RepID=A0ABD3HXI2_9MARC